MRWGGRDGEESAKWTNSCKLWTSFWSLEQGSVEEQDAKRQECRNLALPKMSTIACTALSLSLSLWKPGLGLDALLGHFTPEFRGSDFLMYLEIKDNLRQNGRVHISGWWDTVLLGNGGCWQSHLSTPCQWVLWGLASFKGKSLECWRVQWFWREIWH